MERTRFDVLTAYMQSAWGRELTYAQKAAGWKILGGLPDEAVEGAVSAIIDDGTDRMPPWPVILKATRSIADAMRERLPQLPAGDSLTDQEHQASVIRLRAKQSPEQRRRANRVIAETGPLPMTVRLRLAAELLAPAVPIQGAVEFNRLFDAALDRELKIHAPLLPRERADLA
jgi:hypothetical protein